MTVVAVTGARGRLGSLVCQVIEDQPGLTLGAQLSSGSDPDAGASADVLFDVSHPDASPGIVARAIDHGQKVVVGTSGWSAERLDALSERLEAAPSAGAIVVPNFSLGSVLGTALARMAAPHFDSVEIIEAHHPAKVDSPSGTAVRTAEVIAEARDLAGLVPVDAPFAEQRARGELIAGVPVHSLRLAGVVARQETRFGGAGEVLSITHDTHSTEAYRAGIRAALAAAPTTEGLVVGLDSLLGLGRDT